MYIYIQKVQVDKVATWLRALRRSELVSHYRLEYVKLKNSTTSVFHWWREHFLNYTSGNWCRSRDEHEETINFAEL